MQRDLTLPLPQRVLAGISGGADSVALLHLLLQSGTKVTAVHVNHGLRGEASDGDEAFVQALCERWQVPLLAYRANPPENPGEDWARKMRYAFFRQAAEKTGVNAIALAHHRDDQAETLLMHLLRGSGMTGLQAMSPDSTVDGLRLLRPLLDFSREELREMLREMGQDWREDATNADPRYLRNAIRLEVLPQLEQLAPGCSARLAATAALLQDEEAVLDGLAQDFLEKYGGQRYLPLDALRAQSAAMQRRILRAWWQTQSGGDFQERCLSREQTEALRELIDAGASARCNLPGGWQGQRGWTHLHLLDGSPVQPLPETPLRQSKLLRMKAAKGQTGDGKTAQAMPVLQLEGLVVRSRRTGDWIRPFGSSGRQSLQDYFVNRHVDAAFRDQAPLVCRGSEVLLVGGVGAGDIPRAEKQEHSVLLEWTTTFPWQRE